jgi:hypothetical protein
MDNRTRAEKIVDVFYSRPFGYPREEQLKSITSQLDEAVRETVLKSIQSHSTAYDEGFAAARGKAAGIAAHSLFSGSRERDREVLAEQIRAMEE